MIPLQNIPKRQILELANTLVVQVRVGGERELGQHKGLYWGGGALCGDDAVG